ncbi:hypothetical protein QOZ80_9AG0689360 [Eleusine coracana subsp. coracana]|nr:hypothetical protein QOZ80_9AG0689360 [Eleusine coracana subsp. coracana]
MADTSAAVSVALSKLAALQDVNQYKISRRVRRHIAAIADSLRETHAAVALASEAEAQHELHTAQSSNHGSSSSGLVGETMLMLQRVIDQLEDLDPRSAVRAVPISVPVDDDDARRRRPPPITEAAPYGVVVGVGPQRDQVVEMLRLGEEEEELRVVTIAGPVGMGKTTLAHEVYRTVGPSFDCRAWVSASRSYGEMNILIDILCQVEEEDHPHGGGGVTDLHLMEKIDGILQDKRYLIVLDNVSTSTARNTVVSALPCNALGSRVVVTTSDSFGQLNLRNWPVWWNNHAYGMQSLRSYDDDCDKLLFHTRVFGSTGSCPAELADVSNKIVSECSGVPLALTLVSGLLANKPCTRVIWEQVCDFIAGWNRGDADKGMRNIVLLSYHGLPHYLKT